MEGNLENENEEIGLLEVTNKGIELIKDRDIEVEMEDRKRHHATKTRTIHKATIRTRKNI